MDTENNTAEVKPIVEGYGDRRKASIQVIPNVLQQHADIAVYQAESIYYSQRSSAFSLNDLVNEEERLEANIDGLFISDHEGTPYYKKVILKDDYGELFAATVLSIKLRDDSLFETIFELAEDNEYLLNAIADALIWLPYSGVSLYLDLLYNTRKPEKQYVAIAASAGHRRINIRHLVDALSSANMMLLARAIIAVAELGEESLASKIEGYLVHKEESIRFSANWALTRFGNADAMNNLNRFLFNPLYAERAIFFEVMQKDINKTVYLLRHLFQNNETKRLAVFGMGLLGNPASIDSLIKVMYEDELARVAGEAFSFITGLNLDYENFDQDSPEGFESGPNDNPKDENVEMDRDEDLPWPNPTLIARWWEENKKNFSPQKKYIFGKEMSMLQFKEVLIHGTQIQREFSALAIAVRQRNQPIFNTKAPAKRQIQLLGL